jgi:hypothetical protein
MVLEPVSWEICVLLPPPQPNVHPTESAKISRRLRRLVVANS